MAIQSYSTSEPSEAKDGERKRKLLEKARSRFKLAEEAESVQRRLSLDDLRFRAGEQWDERIKNDRDRDGRPCLVINRIPQFVQQLTNDQRQNRPSIKIHPVDDKADIETAKIIQGLMRHIEYNSNADVAYDTAYESAVIGGRGFWRIQTDYADPLSFEQEILIKRIRNHFSVFFDPFSKEPDGSDANFAFIVEDLSKDEFKEQYPDSELCKAGADWESLGNTVPGWIETDGCRIAEYFYKEYEDRKIVLLSDGETYEESELPAQLPEGVAVVDRRTAKVPVIKWCKFNGYEILKEMDCHGRWLPIVPVYGAELDIDGERILEGIVRNAKDPARMYNYWKSAETEAIALAPRTPFIMAEGQDEGYEEDWETANRRNHARLVYKPVSINGQPAPPPQRNAVEPAVGAITQAARYAADDIKATTGIFDAALGARSNETSGIAIQRRNNQAQTSNFHFTDNLTRSMKHTGRIIVDLIPFIYDTERYARIVGEDGEQKVVPLNQPFEKGGKQVLYAMDVGKYDVTVDVGPSYASKRQEAVMSMIEMTKSIPTIGQAAPDIIARNMDWPGAQELSERLKKTLPPNLTENPDDKKPEIPPQIQQQMQQMGQMIEQLTGKLHEAHDTMDQKTLELESKERIEMSKLQVELELGMAKLGSVESIELMRQELRQIEQRMQLLKFDQPIADEPEQAPMSAPQGDSQGMPPQQMPGGSPAGPSMSGQPSPGGASPGQPMEPTEGPMQ